MQFDDRLATVLRSSAGSEMAARTQFRQLIDLLGTKTAAPNASEPDMAPAPQTADDLAADDLATQALDRLGELSDALPFLWQAATLRQPGVRLRNPALVNWLADREPQVAAAAMAAAVLPEQEWLQVIPHLPVTARGFLRHRSDLPNSAQRLLARLGVGDLVLPEPVAAAEATNEATTEAEKRPETRPAARPVPPLVLAHSQIEPVQPETVVTPLPPAPAPSGAPAEIGALVRRIEAFRRARNDTATAAPSRPSTAELADGPVRSISSFEFEADSSGMISWASPGIAPMVVGITLGDAEPDALASLDPVSARNMELRLPVRDGRISFSAAPAISGLWLIDATPRFAALNRAFEGYAGRIRRQQADAVVVRENAPGNEASDKMRQVLHELRTPVNAIQGFAEIIQQQLFGPAPNEYRALAASVAVDAARLLAGFDEIDRLAKLESRAMQLPAGSSDMRIAVHTILQRLENVLRPRNARLAFEVSGGPFFVGIEQTDAQQLVWRVLATLAGSMAPGEVLSLAMHCDGITLDITADIPAAMRATHDLFDTSGQQRAGSISAGSFGMGFTLRLARAEALAAGGGLRRDGNRLILSLPVLTEALPDNSDDTFGARQGGQS